MSVLGKGVVASALIGMCACAVASAADRLESYYAHPTNEDANGVLAPWYTGQNGQFDERVRIAVEVYKRYPWAEQAVIPAPDFIYNSHWTISSEGEIVIPPTTDWMCGDLSQRAWSIIKGLTDYYRYSGDPVAFMYITLCADYVLEYGQTSEDHPWPRFPISTPTNGAIYGKCDQNSRIQLDLCARLGEDILTAYRLTGDTRYRDAAYHWADLFAAKCNFNPEFAPWDRYVDPSVVGWSDLLTGSTTMILEFLDEVIDSGYTGEGGAILRARDAGRAYVRNVLLPKWTVNDTWGRQYWDWDNPVMCGIVAMCADYMLEHRDAFPNWRSDIRNILSLIFPRNGVDPNCHADTYSGAWAFPESSTCCGTSLSYNQYTAAPTWLRYGVLADSEWAREIGRRMLVMATYDADQKGVVKDGLFGQIVATGEWSNLAHPWPLCQVMAAMRWMPETFGPARENHLMDSTSVVTHVVYGDGRIEYTTFDAPPETVDVLRLAFMPQRITADGAELAEQPDLDRNGFAKQALGNGDYIVRVRHDARTQIVVEGDDPQVEVGADVLEHDAAWKVQDGVLTATAANATLTHRFTGNQVRVKGTVDAVGGFADIHIDGAKQLTVIDCWNPDPRREQVIYSKSGLSNGEHELRIVARGEGNPIAGGSAVRVSSVQYSAAEGAPAFGEGGGPRGVQRMIFGYTGRKDYVDSKGNAWRPGTEFVIRSGYGTDAVKQALWQDRRTMYIGKTGDPELYRYGVHGKEFWINVTVGPGDYYVTLHLASTPLHPFLERDPDGAPVRHKQSVEINGETAIDNFDVADAAGGMFQAVSRTFRDIAPKHGVIELRFTGVEDREAILQALEIGPMSAAPK